MFIFKRPSDEIPLKVVIEQVKSLPQSMKDFLKNKSDSQDGGPAGLESRLPVKFCAYLCMYAADGSIVNGWLASQTDILAEDWVILD